MRKFANEPNDALVTFARKTQLVSQWKRNFHRKSQVERRLPLAPENWKTLREKTIATNTIEKKYRLGLQKNILEMETVRMNFLKVFAGKG